MTEDVLIRLSSDSKLAIAVNVRVSLYASLCKFESTMKAIHSDMVIRNRRKSIKFTS